MAVSLNDKPNTVVVTGETTAVVVSGTGPQGGQGEAGTIAVGAVTTGTAGSQASVTNVGNEYSAILDFVIPRGDTGAAGSAASVTVGSTTTGTAGSTAVVTNSGTSSAAVLNFTIPRGDQGVQGPQGPAGSAATIAVGTTTTLSPGSSATVSNSGTAGAAVLDFGIPQGATGSQGPAGTAATVAVGSVATGTAGSTATVTNSGTSSAAVLNFTIPRGDKGDAGSQGPQGATGPEGGTSTLTTKGDLLTRTSSAVARLPVGATTGHVLTVDPAEATGMKWAAASGGGGIPETLIDAKGDLIVGSAADTAARLAVGATNGHVLAVDSAQSLGVKWTAPTLLTQPRTTLTNNNLPYSGIPGLGSVATTANVQLSANTVYYTPLISTGQPLTLTSAVVRVTTAAAAGNNVRLAIYNANSAWEPTTLVSDIGAVLVDSLGRKAATGLSISLPVGLYLTMVHVQATVSLETWGWSTSWWSSFPITQNSSAAALTASRTYGVAVDPGTAPSAAQHATVTYGYVTYTW